jgi:hypothetical protein
MEKPVIKPNVELTEAQMERLEERYQLKARLVELDKLDLAEGVEYIHNPIARVLDNMLWGTEQFMVKLDQLILNSKPVMSAFRSMLSGNIRAVLALAEVTRHTVRLYALEGRHLSKKLDSDDEQSRLTWYTNPVTAREIGEHMSGLTGRLVYVDLELDYASDHSHRFYKQGDIAYTLRGDLMKASKRKWKYVKISGVTEVAAGRITEVEV